MTEYLIAFKGEWVPEHTLRSCRRSRGLSGRCWQR